MRQSALILGAGLSAADWLAGLDSHPLAKTVFASRIRSEYTVEPEEESLLDLARWASFYYRDPEENRNSLRVRGGNDLVPRRIAAALPDVRTGTPVTAIRWWENGVEV